VLCVCAQHFLGDAEVPQLGGAVFAAAEQAHPIGGDLDRVDRFGVVFEDGVVVLFSGVPEFDVGIVAAACNPGVLVGEEAEAIDGGGVSFEGAEGRA
jgi:hypothetical protein